VAITLADLELKLKSEVSAAASKDVAAMQRVTEAVRESQKTLDRLQEASARKTIARDVAAGRQQLVFASRLEAARGRVKELSNSSTPPAMLVKAKEQAADLAASLESARSKMASIAKTDVGSEAVAKAAGELNALKDAVPNLNRMATSTLTFSKSAQEGAASAMMMTNAITRGLQIAGAAAVAFLAIAAAYLAFGFAAASAARSQRLLGEALTGSAALGTEFNAIIRQLSGEVPLAKDKIAGLAQELSLLKLGRRDLQAGLTAIAFTTSALGESAGSAVKSIVQASAEAKRFSLGMRDMFGEFTGLKGTGLKSADVIGALAAQLKISRGAAEEQLRMGRVSLAMGMRALEEAGRGRFGKIVGLQMLDFPTQIAKAKDALQGMFAGVNIEPLLKGLREFLTIFDTSTVRGRGMQAVLTVALESIAEILGVLLPIGKEVFLGMAIMALRFYLAVRPIGRAIKDFLVQLGAGENSMTWLNVGKAIFIAMAVAAGVLALMVGLVVGPFLILGQAMLVVARLGDMAFKWLTTTIVDLYNYINQIDLGEAATNMVRGLAMGIIANAAAVTSAMEGLATSAISAFKNKMLMRSPPKVFVDIGRAIPLAAASGVERETSALAGATANMGAAAIGGALGGAGDGGAGGGAAQSSITVTIGTLNIGEREASAEEREGFAMQLAAALKLVIGQAGAGQPIGAF